MQLNGNLVIYNTGTRYPVWDSVIKPDEPVPGSRAFIRNGVFGVYYGTNIPTFQVNKANIINPDILNKTRMELRNDGILMMITSVDVVKWTSSQTQVDIPDLY